MKVSLGSLGALSYRVCHSMSDHECAQHVLGEQKISAKTLHIATVPSKSSKMTVPMFSLDLATLQENGLESVEVAFVRITRERGSGNARVELLRLVPAVELFIPQNLRVNVVGQMEYVAADLRRPWG